MCFFIGMCWFYCSDVVVCVCVCCCVTLLGTCVFVWCCVVLFVGCLAFLFVVVGCLSDCRFLGVRFRFLFYLRVSWLRVCVCLLCFDLLLYDLHGLC